MTLDNFEAEISPVILGRAQDYIDAVDLQLPIDNGEYQQWRAQVRGSDQYSVVLQVHKTARKVLYHSCSCPFDGLICKHKAAVLYVVAENASSLVVKAKKHKDKLQLILDQLSSDELRSYIAGLVQSNGAIRKDFMATFAAKTANSVADYKVIVSQALQPLKRNHGFVSAASMTETMEPIQKLLGLACRSMHDDKPEIALMICQAIIEKMAPALNTVDDSNGILSDTIREAFEILHILPLHEIPESIRSQLVTYAIKSATHKNYQGWDYSWDFADLASSVATEKEERDFVKMLTTLKKMHTGDEWITQYAGENAARILMIYLMNNKPVSEVEEFIEQNLKYPSIRKTAVNARLKENNFEEAVALVRGGIQQAETKKMPGVVVEWQKDLLRIYQAQGNKPATIQTAEALFLQSRSDLAYYRILKAEMTPEVWSEAQPRFLKKMDKERAFHSLCTIYADEGRLSDLMSVLKKARKLDLLHDYEDMLLSGFRDQLQDLYFLLIKEMLETHTDRNWYRESARQLKHMLKTYDRDLILKFTDQLRQKYRQRKALQDELKIIK